MNLTKICSCEQMQVNMNKKKTRLMAFGLNIFLQFKAKGYMDFKMDFSLC